MAFENVKISNPYREDGLASRIDLRVASCEEVADVETKLGLEFPRGYRDFVTTLGRGLYYGHNTEIRVDMPDEIFSKYKEHQEFLNEYWFWEKGEALLPKAKAKECIKICDTSDGDVLVFHPSNPNELFALPHEDELSHRAGTDLYEALDWLVEQGSRAAGGSAESLKRREFVPYHFAAQNRRIIPPECFY